MKWDSVLLLPCVGNAEVAALGGSYSLPQGITLLGRWSTEESPFLATVTPVLHHMQTSYRQDPEQLGI